MTLQRAAFNSQEKACHWKMAGFFCKDQQMPYKEEILRTRWKQEAMRVSIQDIE